MTNKLKHPSMKVATTIPDNLLKIIFGFFSRHEQLCQIARVSKSFRAVVNSIVEDDSSFQALSTQAHTFGFLTYTRHQFFHAGRLCHQEFDAFLNSAWSFAAFMGDEPKLIELLGSDYHTHKDDSERTVAHFAAFGGQLPLLKKMVATHGKDAIAQADMGGYRCTHFAAIRQHMTTLQWLVLEQQFSLFEKAQLFGVDALDCIENNLRLEYKNQTIINEHNARLLAPLLCEKHDAKQYDLESLKAELSKIDPDQQYQDINRSLNEAKIDTVILCTTQHIVDKQRALLPFLQALLDYKNTSKINNETVAPKFLFLI